MRSHVWQQHPFVPRPWSEIASFLDDMAGAHPEFAHMAAIVDTVIGRGAETDLAGCTSMHDLLVVPTPVPDPPYDVIRVCSPSSIRVVGAGWVLIEHVTVTGRDDRIYRPVTDAVPLFWRFIREKFGIVPS
ncbi:hypothetical protein V6U81_03505 [Micromonospora sp. CPCC 205711]|uniref:hypothetical protein n=1 Tax=Micromonospora sp. CPCC 205547 TaxID=3122400 RepID=UPI002FF085F2